MSDKKYVVPDGMLMAGIKTSYSPDPIVNVRRILEAALRWQSENPPRPTVEQAQTVWNEANRGASFRWRLAANGRLRQIDQDFLSEWIRRMYLAPEPEAPKPEGVSDKERADCNMACLLHLVGIVERDDRVAAKGYAEYERAMLRLIEARDSRQKPLCRHCNEREAGGMMDATLCGPCYNTRAEWEAPEEIEDLLWGEGHPDTRHHLSAKYLNKNLIEAFNRGKKSVKPT